MFKGSVDQLSNEILISWYGYYYTGYYIDMVLIPQEEQRSQKPPKICFCLSSLAKPSNSPQLN